MYHSTAMVNYYITSIIWICSMNHYYDWYSSENDPIFCEYSFLLRAYVVKCLKCCKYKYYAAQYDECEDNVTDDPIEQYDCLTRVLIDDFLESYEKCEKDDNWQYSGTFESDYLEYKQ